MEDWEREVWKAHKEQLEDLMRARDAALSELTHAEIALMKAQTILLNSIRSLNLDRPAPPPDEDAPEALPHT